MPKPQTIHASLAIINNQGILMTGPAGIGKSELCLQLLDRGHRLVCDDMVTLNLDKTLIGSAPSTLYGKLALRDIGIIDVAQHYHHDALCKIHPIHLHVKLTQSAPHPNPLSLTPTFETIMDTQLPTYVLSVNDNRPIALLIEILAFNLIKR